LEPRATYLNWLPEFVNVIVSRLSWSDPFKRRDARLDIFDFKTQVSEYLAIM